MRVKGLLITLLALAMIAVSSQAAIAASEGVDAKGNGDQIVWVKPSGTSLSIMPMSVTSSITQGQNNWHSKVVSSYIISMEIDLNWGNTANSLTLTLYDPNSNNCGTFYDRDDGHIDGRIHFYVNNPNGVTQGTWNANVYGYRVSGIQSYTI